jgi:hypothetical protein
VEILSSVVLPEPVGEGLLGQVLRPDAELVLLEPGDAARASDVLGRLPHRDVDVGHLAVGPRVVPRGLRLGGRRGAGLGGVEGRVLRVGQGVAAPLGESGDALDAAGDEHVALARLDRVVGHPGGLQRGRAVAVDGGARHGVEPEEDGGHPGDVEPLLASGQPAADDKIFDRGGIKCRNLRQRRRHHLRQQIVGPD